MIVFFSISTHKSQASACGSWLGFLCLVFQLEDVFKEVFGVFDAFAVAQDAEVVFFHGLAQIWGVGFELEHGGGEGFFLGLAHVLAGQAVDAA